MRSWGKAPHISADSETVRRVATEAGVHAERAYAHKDGSIRADCGRVWLEVAPSKEILSMYTKGMAAGDIETLIRDIYGLEVSDMTVSRITDKILPVTKNWQRRPLESIYAMVFLDAIYYHVHSEVILGIAMRIRLRIFAQRQLMMRRMS